MGAIDNAISYESDGYGWAMEQAALLRDGRLSEADIENIAQELADMGGSLRSERVDRLSVLLCHLLKWQFQPSHRAIAGASRSWSSVAAWLRISRTTRA